MPTLLDTHAWVWWVHGDARLSEEHREMLDARAVEGIGVSIISCWEVAKLVEYGRPSFRRTSPSGLGSPSAIPACDCLSSPLASWSSRLAYHSPSIRTRQTR